MRVYARTLGAYTVRSFCDLWGGDTYRALPKDAIHKLGGKRRLVDYHWRYFVAVEDAHAA